MRATAVEKLSRQRQHHTTADQDGSEQVLLAGPARQRRHQIQRSHTADDRQRGPRLVVPSRLLTESIARLRRSTSTATLTIAKTANNRSEVVPPSTSMASLPAKTVT